MGPLWNLFAIGAQSGILWWKNSSSGLSYSHVGNALFREGIGMLYRVVEIRLFQMSWKKSHCHNGVLILKVTLNKNTYYFLTIFKNPTAKILGGFNSSGPSSLGSSLPPGAPTAISSTISSTAAPSTVSSGLGGGLDDLFSLGPSMATGAVNNFYSPPKTEWLNSMKNMVRLLFFAAYVICKKNYSFGRVVFFQIKIASSFYSKINDSSRVRTTGFSAGSGFDSLVPIIFMTYP